MATVAVICEYNLFHCGHARLISAIRERFGEDTAVLSLMSGNFTQRGIPAATDKYIRAHAALLSGSDLTLELPPPYSMAVAEDFATGAVRLLSALGGVDYLAFGSESGDPDALSLIAARRSGAEFAQAFDRALKTADPDESFIRTRERVYAELYGGNSLAPNDQLGVEYLNALTDTNMKPAVFLRTGDESATAARAAFLNGDRDALAALVPQSALSLYEDAPRVSEVYLSRAILAFLRFADPEYLTGAAGMNADLAYRFLRLAGECAAAPEFFERCATKKYTRARIRRGVLSAMLGVTDADCERSPAYTLVLSASKRGCALLSDLRKTSSIPIFDKGTQITDPLAARSDALYTLAYEKPMGTGTLLRKSPVIGK